MGLFGLADYDSGIPDTLHSLTLGESLWRCLGMEMEFVHSRRNSGSEFMAQRGEGEEEAHSLRFEGAADSSGHVLSIKARELIRYFTLLK